MACMSARYRTSLVYWDSSGGQAGHGGEKLLDRDLPTDCFSPPSQSTDADMLVCTVGEVRVWPGASNVIPGSTQLSIDIRQGS